MLIGLTGQIGAGKSTAAEIYKELSAAVVDADSIGRQVVDESPALLKKLVKRFGREILTRAGKLDRKALARKAFATPENKRALDGLVHPYLLKELHRQVKIAGKKHEVVVIDAALLLNWGLDSQVDATVAVIASQKVRVLRMAARGFSRDEILARQKAQYPLSEYRRRATHVIANNGSREELRRKVQRLWKRWFPKAS